MTNALESRPRAPTIQREQAPRPALLLNPERMDESIATILRTIKRCRRREGCGCYLFIEPTMTVFILTENQHIAQKWIRERFRAFVGTYCPVSHQRGLAAPKGVAEGMTATFDGVREDVIDHLRGLGVVL